MDDNKTPATNLVTESQTRPLYLANSETRPLDAFVGPPIPLSPPPPPEPAENPVVITLGQLAQPKPGGIQ